MKMLSTGYLYDWDVITCIQTVNKNNTRSNNQSEQTYVILHGLINGTERKQAQSISTGKVNYGRDTNTKINQKILT